MLKINMQALFCFITVSHWNKNSNDTSFMIIIIINVTYIKIYILKMLSLDTINIYASSKFSETMFFFKEYNLFCFLIYNKKIWNITIMKVRRNTLHPSKCLFSTKRRKKNAQHWIIYYWNENKLSCFA